MDILYFSFSILRPEEEASVKAIDIQIANKQQELQIAIADTPVYALPDMYRTEENKGMSDEEYLRHLKSIDEQRVAEKEANEIALKQERAEKKAAEKVRRMEQNETKHQEMFQRIVDGNYGEKAKNAGEVIGKVIFWIASVFDIFFAIVSFTTNGGILSGILFVLTAVCINPLLMRYIRRIGIKIPVWLLIVVLIVGFFAGVLTFPVA